MQVETLIKIANRPYLVYGDWFEIQNYLKAMSFSDWERFIDGLRPVRLKAYKRFIAEQI